MKTHELKCWPEFFAPLLSGLKTAELRYNDRRYEVGDVLRLREWEPGDHPDFGATAKYTGRECWCRVTHVLHGVGTVGAIAPLKGLSVGYVMLSLTPAVLKNVFEDTRGHTDREIADDDQTRERPGADRGLSGDDRAA